MRDDLWNNDLWYHNERPVESIAKHHAWYEALGSSVCLATPNWWYSLLPHEKSALKRALCKLLGGGR